MLYPYQQMFLKEVNRRYFVNKYGVDTTQDNSKTAGEKQKCPECGSALDPDSPTPKCPVHGTAPFEEKK
jgi:methionyl-tRNA synthetase